MKYPNPDSKSAAMFEQAQRVLTEGGSPQHDSHRAVFDLRAGGERQIHH